jgi:hypothetical protein
MKHLKKFENFYLSPDVDSDEQEFIDYSKKLRSTSSEIESDFDEELSDVMPDEISSEEGDWDRENAFASDEEEGDWNEEDNYNSSEEEEGDAPSFSEDGRHIMSFEAKNNSYKKGKKKSRPDFLDLDKDGDKKESMKKAAKDAKEDKKEGKGLTAAQKKLPEGLRKAIEAKKK